MLYTLMRCIINTSASPKIEIKIAVQRGLHFVPELRKIHYPPRSISGYHKEKAGGSCSKGLLYLSNSVEFSFR